MQTLFNTTINIIGSGLTGLTIARILADHNIHSIIYEKRDKIGGNCSTTWLNKIEIHDYGPHIFHTSNSRVWKFINRFTEFNGFKLNVLTNVNEHLYHMPFGLDLINNFFSINLKPQDVNVFLKTKQIINTDPQNLEEQALSLVGKDIYEAFIKGYTIKQWNKDPKDLPPEIIQRIPFRTTYDNNYFNDRYQGIPLNGYNALFEKMLKSEYISLTMNKQFSIHDVKPNQIYFYTGPIDELFEYKFGKLEWRSLNFKFKTLNINDYQGAPLVNYPSIDVKFTRIHEYKHFHPEINYDKLNKTIICEEYPENYTGLNEKYYPVNTNDNNLLFNKYQQYAKIKYPNIILCGRLAEYKYFDMDDAILNAFNVVNNFLINI